MMRDRGLACDVLITPDPSASLARAGVYLHYAEYAREKLEQRIAKKQGKTP